MKTFILSCCALLLLSACRTEADIDYGEIVIAESTVDYEKELSYAPAEKVTVNTSLGRVTIDFGLDEIMANNILSEYGLAAVGHIRTVGDLIGFYRERRPSFGYSYESFFQPGHDNDFVFPKLEYRLAQECFQETCSSDTRRYVLNIAISKQKFKYEAYTNSFTAARTGIFLMAVILIRENDAGFINAVGNDADLQRALRMNINLPTDREFADNMIRFAEKFLSNQ